MPNKTENKNDSKDINTNSDNNLELIGHVDSLNNFDNFWDKLRKSIENGLTVPSMYNSNGANTSFFGKQAKKATEMGRVVNIGTKAEINNQGIGDIYISSAIGAFKNGNKI